MLYHCNTVPLHPTSSHHPGRGLPVLLEQTNRSRACGHRRRNSAHLSKQLTSWHVTGTLSTGQSKQRMRKVTEAHSNVHIITPLTHAPLTHLICDPVFITEL